jgi:hypothetical protein
MRSSVDQVREPSPRRQRLREGYAFTVGLLTFIHTNFALNDGDTPVTFFELVLSHKTVFGGACGGSEGSGRHGKDCDSRNGVLLRRQVAACEAYPSWERRPGES